ncbi:alpha/beta fold hydrolase [Streptomyces sp. NPDC059556]|uniref:alpha/beta fold hydrolase n=1 Tax=Streptomyces sp. NPDC059556 TaxID=3346863 RepID=UPI00367B3145
MTHGKPEADDEDGYAPPYEDARGILFGDVPDADADADADADRAVARLRPQSVRSFTEPLTRAGWRTVPPSSIVCDRDRALEPSRQRELAPRAHSVHRLPSGHSPFLSMPGQLAALLHRTAASAPPASRWPRRRRGRAAARLRSPPPGRCVRTRYGGPDPRWRTGPVTGVRTRDLRPDLRQVPCARPRVVIPPRTANVCSEWTP